MDIIKEKKYKIILSLYLITILLISCMNTGGKAGFGYDKINHIIAFIVLSLLIYLAFKKIRNIWIFIWGLGYGIFIEIMQSFFPSRSCEFLDIVADVVGILIGLVIINLIKNKRYLKYFI